MGEALSILNFGLKKRWTFFLATAYFLSLDFSSFQAQLRKSKGEEIQTSGHLLLVEIDFLDQNSHFTSASEWERSGGFKLLFCQNAKVNSNIPSLKWERYSTLRFDGSGSQFLWEITSYSQLQLWKNPRRNAGESGQQRKRKCRPTKKSHEEHSEWHILQNWGWSATTSTLQQ